MSAQAAAPSSHAVEYVRPLPIRTPEDLELPPEIAEVFEALTNEGRRDYIHQLMDALEESQRTNDLRPVRAVIESHYRTLLVIRHPRYDELRDRASRPSEAPRLTPEEFRKKLAG